MKVNIEKLGGLGDGVARHQGKPMIVPAAVPGDELDVSIISSNNKRTLAEIRSILRPSADRTEPPCRHFGRCGGCLLQHINEQLYQNFKLQLLRQTLARAGIDAGCQQSFQGTGPATRRRAMVHISLDEKVEIGFYRPRSRTIVDMLECHQLQPELFEVVAQLRTVLSESAGVPGLKDIHLTSVDQGIDLILQFDTTPEEKQLHNLAAAIENTCTNVCRLSYANNSSPAVLHAADTVTVDCHGTPARYPAGAFLQATAMGQALITRQVLAAYSGGVVTDLYSGCGAFSLPLLATGAQVHAFDGDARAIGALQQSIADHGWSGMGTATQRNLFRNPLAAEELKPFSMAVINPPRNGAEPQMAALAESSLETIVVVSCYPRSFERDARLLVEAGFSCPSAIAVDQFHWTPHLEIVARFQR